MSKKVSDQLVEMLENSGVKRIYAVTGDSLNHINDAVRRNGKIDWIHVRHEEVGAYAAGAEAQLTGKLACCAGSSGPGHVHLVNGLYDAHRSGAPVVAIASTMATGEFGTGYFQETNTIRLFGDCSYYNELAATSHEVPRMLHGAMQTALGRRGVGVIGIPGDITSMKAAEISSAVKSFYVSPTVCPSEEELREFAKILNDNKKITLFCGIGAKDAHDEVITLSQKLNAPIVYTFKGKMEIQYDNPNEVGMTGLLGNPSGYNSMHEADVLVLLGTDFPYENFMPDKNIIVQVDIDAAKLGNRAKVDYGYCGDIKTTLKDLLPLIEQKSDDSFLKHQLNGYEKVKKHLQFYVDDKGKKDLIHPEYVMARIDACASNNAIFTVDTGMTCVWGARYLNATKDRQMLGSFNHGSMANAMPQAIGAQLAFPTREVWALCGDGGLSMLLGDLATIVQYKLPIKIIVFNNRSLGMVKLEMEVAGLPDWQTDMSNSDFAKVAEATGMRGITVSNPEDVEPALEEACNSKEAILINVMTDPNALAMPPKVEFAQMTGFAKSMYRLMIDGRSKEVVDTIKANFRHVKDIF